jgi:hypothetical protein
MHYQQYIFNYRDIEGKDSWSIMEIAMNKIIYIMHYEAILKGDWRIIKKYIILLVVYILNHLLKSSNLRILYL